MPQLERTLNEGLNGEEIVVAVLDKTATILRDHIGRRKDQAALRAEISVNLELDDVPGTKVVDREISYEGGEGLENEQIVAALIIKIGITLRKDCYLNRTTNWRAIRMKINAVLEIEESEPIVVEKIVENQPPNVIRVETGQAVPTEVTGKDGRKRVEGVKYDRNDAKRAMSKATK